MNMSEMNEDKSYYQLYDESMQEVKKYINQNAGKYKKLRDTLYNSKIQVISDYFLNNNLVTMLVSPDFQGKSSAYKYSFQNTRQVYPRKKEIYNEIAFIENKVGGAYFPREIIQSEIEQEKDQIMKQYGNCLVINASLNQQLQGNKNKYFIQINWPSANRTKLNNIILSINYKKKNLEDNNNQNEYESIITIAKQCEQTSVILPQGINQIQNRIIDDKQFTLLRGTSFITQFQNGYLNNFTESMLSQDEQEMQQKLSFDECLIREGTGFRTYKDFDAEILDMQVSTHFPENLAVLQSNNGLYSINDCKDTKTLLITPQQMDINAQLYGISNSYHPQINYVHSIIQIYSIDHRKTNYQQLSNSALLHTNPSQVHNANFKRIYNAKHIQDYVMLITTRRHFEFYDLRSMTSPLLQIDHFLDENVPHISTLSQDIAINSSNLNNGNQLVMDLKLLLEQKQKSKNNIKLMNQKEQNQKTKELQQTLNKNKQINYSFSPDKYGYSVALPFDCTTMKRHIEKDKMKNFCNYDTDLAQQISTILNNDQKLSYLKSDDGSLTGSSPLLLHSNNLINDSFRTRGMQAVSNYSTGDQFIFMCDNYGALTCQNIRFEEQAKKQYIRLNSFNFHQDLAEMNKNKFLNIRWGQFESFQENKIINSKEAFKDSIQDEMESQSSIYHAKIDPCLASSQQQILIDEQSQQQQQTLVQEEEEILDNLRLVSLGNKQSTNEKSLNLTKLFTSIMNPIKDSLLNIEQNHHDSDEMCNEQAKLKQNEAGGNEQKKIQKRNQDLIQFDEAIQQEETQLENLIFTQIDTNAIDMDKPVQMQQNLNIQDVSNSNFLVTDNILNYLSHQWDSYAHTQKDT